MTGAAKRDQVGTKYILLQNGKYLEFCVQYYFSLSCKILPIELFIDGKNLSYLSVLTPGSNTRSGSNIRRVVQQNERNKRLGPFKCWVLKLNLINLKMVPNVKEN